MEERLIMADITMCGNDKCPIKNKCYRYTAPKDPYRQSWQVYVYDKKTKSCEGFKANRKTKSKKVR